MPNDSHQPLRPEATLRDARPEDADAVHALMTTDAALAGTMRTRYMPLQRTVERLEPARGAIRIVAILDDEIVGFGEMLTYPDVPRHQHAADINMVVVAESLQGSGIGRALMEALIDQADNWLQVTRIGLVAWTNNDRAIGLYESLGFEVEGTMKRFVFTDGAYVDAVTMARFR